MIGRSSHRHFPMHLRRGSVYLSVLFAGLLVASACAAALLTSNRVVRLETEEGNNRAAQMLADSALEWAVACINDNSSWRTKYSHNVDVTTMKLQGGTMTFRLVDTDGSLTDDNFDSVDIIATGRIGSAAHAWQATLEPSGSATTGLSYSIAARKSISLGAPASWTTNESIAAGQGITVSSGAVLSANYTVGTTASGTITGAGSSSTTPPEIPGVTALDGYSKIAVKLDVSLLKLSGTERRISAQLLSGGDNTLGGAVNSKGVYTLDCGGATLRIQNSRLVATLIVKNATSVILSDSLHWEAPKGNYPLLVTDAPVTLAVTRVPLDETTLLVNFNPTTTPYRDQSDILKTASYPSQLRGMIYTNSTITVDPTAEIELQGCLQCDSIAGSGHLLIEHRDVFRATPPRGFRKSNQMTMVPGTLRRTALP